MRDNPGKLSRFWKDLKRRGVLRSLAVYAGTAFVVLEAATIIFPRWNLPDWSIDLLLYLLILGAFIAVIVSWIFDLTPQGVHRTKSLEEEPEPAKAPDSRRWKAATYISLVIIVGLIIFNVLQNQNLIKAGDIQSMVVLPLTIDQMTLIAVFLLISHNLIQEAIIQANMSDDPLKSGLTDGEIYTN